MPARQQRREFKAQHAHEVLVDQDLARNRNSIDDTLHTQRAGPAQCSGACLPLTIVTEKKIERPRPTLVGSCAPIGGRRGSRRNATLDKMRPRHVLPVQSNPQSCMDHKPLDDTILRVQALGGC